MVHRHINGTIRDTGPFLLPAFLLALALPVAFGLTSGVWDVAHGTRIPADVRAALYGPLRARRPHDRYPDRDNRLTPRLT
jgi:hypothetical protein